MSSLAPAAADAARSHWVVRSRADVAPGSDWLSPAEQERLATLRVPKRRADWLVGRWAAKHALAQCLRHEGLRPRLAEIEVLPAPDGAPRARVAGSDLELGVSISHSGDYGFSVACVPAQPLGCDIERVEAHSARFLQDYFTPAEAAFLEHAPAASRPFLATLFWSAKESALKARRVGLRADTRTADVRLVGDRFDGRCGLLVVRGPDPNDVLRGCWWRADGFVQTMVGAGSLCSGDWPPLDADPALHASGWPVPPGTPG